jgi:hypothetical protein
MTVSTREAGAAFADVVYADPAVGGRRVRGADLGLLQRAARAAAAARAAQGPAAPRHPAPALQAACARPCGRQYLPGRKAGTWPAALAPGASPGRPAGRRPCPDRAAARTTAISAPGTARTQRERRTSKEPSSQISWPPVRGGLPGAPPRAAPGPLSVAGPARGYQHRPRHRVPPMAAAGWGVFHK